MPVLIRIESSSGRFRLSVDERNPLINLYREIGDKVNLDFNQFELHFDLSGENILRNDLESLISDSSLSSGNTLFVVPKIDINRKKILETNADKKCLNSCNISVANEKSPITPHNIECDSKIKRVDINKSNMVTLSNLLDEPNVQVTTKWEDIIGEDDDTIDAVKSMQGNNDSLNSKSVVIQDNSKKEHYKSFEEYMESKNFDISGMPLICNYTPAISTTNEFCLAPSISLHHPTFRNTDYISFENVSEINRFLSYWVENLYCCSQMFGILFGYYLIDANGKTRAIVETIFEPLQTRKEDGFIVENTRQTRDEWERATKLATALGLEPVGMIFSSFSKTEGLSAEEVIFMAKMQSQFIHQHHYTKYPRSTFLTVIVTPDKKGTPQLSVWQVTDLLLSLINAGLLMIPYRQCFGNLGLGHALDDIPRKKISESIFFGSNREPYEKFCKGINTIESLSSEIIVNNYMYQKFYDDSRKYVYWGTNEETLEESYNSKSLGSVSLDTTKGLKVQSNTTSINNTNIEDEDEFELVRRNPGIGEKGVFIGHENDALKETNSFYSILSSDSNRNLLIRPSRNRERFPHILENGKQRLAVSVDWFLFRIPHGIPKNSVPLLPRTNAPRYNRDMPASNKFLKDYIDAELGWLSFADFHLLLRLMEIFDIEIILQIANDIRHRRVPHDEYVSQIKMLLAIACE